MSAPPRRSYGYTENGKVVPAEAAVIRAAAESVIAGQPLAAVCDGLNEAGHRTVTGGEWHPTSLVRLLLSPKVAGQRVAPAILDPATVDAIAARQQARRAAGVGRPPGTGGTRLLSTLLRCARCGSTMHATATHAGKRDSHGYRCPAAVGACGGQTIIGPALDAYVTEQAIAVLATSPTAPRPAQAAELEADLGVLEATAETLSRARGAGIMTAAEYESAARRLGHRRDRARAALATALGQPLPPTQDPAALASWFAGAPIPLARGVLKYLWQRIDIVPTRRRGYPGIDPDRVQFVPAASRVQIAG